ncbi:unnamed protein product [Mytilus edulis]|uniref:B box-type domain-containing protein n=1 Tax=Mytilus edulis TaxID=6550 RepID=A0A8S3PMF7_MYTED|nr:unnamed protein product [Mytilus edulis]
MASSKPIPCGPCQEGKVNTKADIWCYNCDEGLCSACSGHHKRFKGTRDHKTIDIKSYKPSIQAIKTECDKHGQQLNLYCPSHLMPCCDECEREYECIQDFVVKNRKEINSHLTRLEKKLCNEAETILNQVKSEASDFITEIEGKQKNLKKMQEHLHTVIPHTSKLQSFLGLHQIEQQVHQCQQYVEDLENDDRAKEFNIKMKQNDEIAKDIEEIRITRMFRRNNGC